MVQIANPRPHHAAEAPDDRQPWRVELLVSRRSYLLARPSQRVMRAAGRASASASRKAANADVMLRHAELLRNAGVSEREIAQQTGFVA